MSNFTPPNIVASLGRYLETNNKTGENGLTKTALASIGANFLLWEDEEKCLIT